MSKDTGEARILVVVLTYDEATRLWNRRRAVSAHPRAVFPAAVATDVLARGARWQRTGVAGSVLLGGAAIGCPAGVRHRRLLPRQGVAPLVACFGPATVAADSGSGAERQTVG